jgi:2-polyprenyl-3-methyl-5-hydroxy-6-metoxy-1,4-benzoquinol methylase
MKQNTSDLWNNFWKKETSIKEDKFYLKKEELGIRWQRIESAIIEKLGSFQGLRTIEIGVGTGTISALLRKKGAEVTVFDYSEKALEQAGSFFYMNGLNVNCIKSDALNLPENTLNSYDVSISLGLTEHFKGQNRFTIKKAHFDILKKGGITFISVLNKYNPPYRIFKFLTELTEKWSVGVEYPYSRKEFKEMMSKMKISTYSFLADSFWRSFFMINPVRIFKKFLI